MAVRVEVRVVDEVEFNGVIYRRYPESPRRSTRLYYRGKRDGAQEFLHRAIWQAAHGVIPDGYEIHHRDGDALNNQLDNLLCLSPTDHSAAHWSPERSERARAHAAKIRPLTREWHLSHAGREWHRRHGKRTWEDREPVDASCVHCAATFKTYFPTRAKYCSEICKTASRVASGCDDETRVCPECGGEFVRNKHQRAECCSRACAAKLRNKRRLAVDR